MVPVSAPGESLSPCRAERAAARGVVPRQAFWRFSSLCLTLRVNQAGAGREACSLSQVSFRAGKHSFCYMRNGAEQEEQLLQYKK